MVVPIQVTFDCADPDRLARFWAELLGYQLDPPPEGYDCWETWLIEHGVPESEWNTAEAVIDPEGHGPRLFFQRVPEPKEVKNRVHLDVNVGGPRAHPTTSAGPPSMRRSNAPSPSGRQRSVSSTSAARATTS